MPNVAYAFPLPSGPLPSTRLPHGEEALGQAGEGYCSLSRETGEGWGGGAAEKPVPPESLATLRTYLRRSESGWRTERPSWPCGLAAIDQTLPGGGLQRGGVHEFVAADGNHAPAYGFLATLLANEIPARPILWCLREAAFDGAALARLGLSPERIVFARARRPNDLLWAMEEGLRTRGLGAVVGEPERLDLTASRRLQLAAQSSGVTCFVLRIGRNETNNAAVTRWQIGTAPGLVYTASGLDDAGPLRGRWQVRLLRCRGAVPAEDGTGFGSWLVTERDPQHPPEATPWRAAAAPITAYRIA